MPSTRLRFRICSHVVGAFDCGAHHPLDRQAVHAEARTSAASARAHPVHLRERTRVGVIALDISASGMSVVMPCDVPAGAHLTASMSVPGYSWSGDVSVARAESRPSRNGFDIWLLGLQFEQKQRERDIAPFRMDTAA